MKTFLNILFVYIPFALCLIIQAALILTLYSDEEGVASMAKWILPLVFITGLAFHFFKKNKK